MSLAADGALRAEPIALRAVKDAAIDAEIRDRFAPPKEIDRQTVLDRYQMVKLHDRVGRMADTLEYSLVALPLDRFDANLLKELRTECGSTIEIEGEDKPALITEWIMQFFV